MWRVLILMSLALFLAGCLPDKGAAFAQCEERLYASARLYAQDTDLRQFRTDLQRCMRAKGFELSKKRDLCDVHVGATYVHCYRPAGWVAAVLDDFSPGQP